jgi:hypothetical protein
VTPAGTLTVTLSGDVPVLEEITAADIVAFVDAQGRGAGLHALPVVLTAPPGASIESVVPRELGIAITLRE